MRTLGLAVAVLLAAYEGSASAGQCAPQFLSPQIVTPDKAVIPVGGGILVADGNRDEVTAAVGPLKDWRFVNGKRRVAPKLRVLAPGLTVLEGTGTRLDNAKGIKLRSFTQRKITSALTAPTVKAVESRSVSAGRRINTYVNVVLSKPASLDGFVVVFDKEGKVPRSFGVAKAGATSVLVYSAGECNVLPDGTQVTQTGDTITLAWVSDTGLMSAPSAAIKVVSTDPTDRAPGGP
jgi:hypothetical protein